MVFTIDKKKFFLGMLINIFIMQLPSVILFAQDISFENELNSYVKEVQRDYKIPGLSIAILKDNQLIYEQRFGLANIELSVAIDRHMLFPIFSTTKLFSVIATYQLVEAQQLSLETYVATFIDDLPHAWKKIKIKHLLTHSSGLSDIYAYRNDDEAIAKQKVYHDTIKFLPGFRFDYNQTNYWLLSKVFQKITGNTLADYILKNQFPNAAKHVLFEGDPMEIVQNQVSAYSDYDFKTYLKKTAYNVPTYLYGGSGMTLSLNEFILWEQKFNQGKFINKESRKMLVTPFKYEEKNGLSKTYGFSSGLSLIDFKGNWSYGFTGSAACGYRRFPKHNLTIILLSNGMFIPNDQLNGIDEVINNLADLIISQD